ncbi:MAG: hypothetical protein A3E85_00295 [Gammaproteobacteria bacterium RIFCSPHIGHO2_12_FULL_45_12]|nr:MAG: hypothetical protein A3E85_00295 [Gammaproteobacteria bacterium RIFCSPHIGHO2_12_FULL_45_12]
MKYLQPDWPAPDHIKAYTTLRQAASTPEQIAASLPLPETPIWIKQVHGATVVDAEQTNAPQEADAIFTSQPNRVCAILTADCLPLLVCNRQGTQVAAIHAGWRGLAAGIIEATFKALKQPADEWLVWLGPAIGPQKFEVGKEVYDAFVSQNEDARAAFTPQTQGKWLANLYQLARLRLHRQGVQAIYGGNFCTYTETNLFYSYRRDHGKTGRMVSLIWNCSPKR